MYPITSQSRNWDAVADLLTKCDASPSGVAAYPLGPDDSLVGAPSQSTSEQLAAVLSDDGEPADMAIAMYSERINFANHRRRTASAYPVAGDHRWRLPEGDLQLVRLVDVGRFAVEFHHDGAVVAMVPE